MKWIEADERLPDVAGAYFCFDKRYKMKKLMHYNPVSGKCFLISKRSRFMWLDESMSEETIWYRACQTQLNDISKVFLTPSNQDAADKESDREVFQAIGETIVHFKLSKFNLK